MATDAPVQRKGLKRFYKIAAVQAVETAFCVCLDGRPVKTPGRADMRLPTRALADAVAEEWTVQGAEIDLAAMPLTVLAWASIDRTGADRDQAISDAIAYGEHDLVCYRAEGPADLVARQKAAWQPLLDWAARDLDAPLVCTAGVISVPQPPHALTALQRAVAGKSDFELVALGAAVKASGSLVIGLALCAGRIDAAGAFAAAHIDELYQMEHWGEDAEAIRRHAAIRRELESAQRLVDLLRG